MSLKPFHCEEQIKVEGETYRLVLNFGAIDAIERIESRGFDQIIPELVTGSATLGTQGRVVWGLLREHHPEITLEEAASLLFNDAGAVTGIALGNIIKTAFMPEDEKAKGKNPPRRRGASKSS